MADQLRDIPELRPFVMSNVWLTGNKIGCGAYGSVEEVEIPGARCAAKRIHDIFQDRSEIPPHVIERATSKFVEECQLMTTLRHPHIVQFLGICFLPGSRLPALVMELLLTSLHDLLVPSENGSELRTNYPDAYIPLGLKRSILHDVARGLTHLHERSPPIIHRDLSARNVLLNSAMVAKIADLGVARIVPQMSTAAALTKAPGAFVYMPPEAITASDSVEDKASYDTSIDVFSLGVVAIFTLSQTFPCKLDAPTYTDAVTGLLKARNELERRHEYMNKIYSKLREGHPLVRIIQQCLHNLPALRPGIREVLYLLEQARAEVGDVESDMNKLELIQALQNQPRCQQGLHEVTQQLSQKENELIQLQETCRRDRQLIEDLRQQNEENQRESSQLQQLVQDLRQQDVDRDELLQAKDRELARAQTTVRETSDRFQEQLRQQELSSRREIHELELQLQSSETLVAEFQKMLVQKNVELEALGCILDSRTLSTVLPIPKPRKYRNRPNAQQSSQPPSRPTNPVSAELIIPPPSTQGSPLDARQTESQLTVDCRSQKAAPIGMTRGAAATDRNFAYFTPLGSNAVYCYTLSEDVWQQLPPCPYRNSGLVVIDGVLTSVGGKEGYSHYTNKLLTLRQDRWVEEYPAMMTTRDNPAVVSTSDSRHTNVIVSGGSVRDSDWTDVVELFNVETNRWARLISLPQLLAFPSAAVCGDRLYVIGCHSDGFSCPLQALISNDTSIESQPTSHTLSWMPLSRLPVPSSTAASLRGQLVIIGGWRGRAPYSSIHQLVDGWWVKIGSVSNGNESLVVNPAPDKIVVVGGEGAVKSVEVCTVV